MTKVCHFCKQVVNEDAIMGNGRKWVGIHQQCYDSRYTVGGGYMKTPGPLSRPTPDRVPIKPGYHMFSHLIPTRLEIRGQAVKQAAVSMDAFFAPGVAKPPEKPPEASSVPASPAPDPLEKAINHAVDRLRSSGYMESPRLDPTRPADRQPKFDPDDQEFLEALAFWSKQMEVATDAFTTIAKRPKEVVQEAAVCV